MSARRLCLAHRADRAVRECGLDLSDPAHATVAAIHVATGLMHCFPRSYLASVAGVRAHQTWDAAFTLGQRAVAKRAPQRPQPPEHRL